jgi:hypothetical protein
MIADALLGILKYGGGLIGVVLGFLLSEIPRRRREQQARLSRLHAVRIEVEHCGEMLRTFIRDPKLAPLYRLPTGAGEHALGAIATDGTLGDAATQSLLRYYTQVDEVNRGLDLATQARAADNSKMLAEEFDRLFNFKVPGLLNAPNPGELSLQERVERALKGALHSK